MKVLRKILTAKNERRAARKIEQRIEKEKLQKIKDFAEKHKEGFTLYTSSLQEVKGSFWSVAFEATQNSFGVDGLEKAFKYAEKHGGIIGGWCHEGEYYFDACQLIENEEDAVTLGRANKQISIYNLETEVTIYL